MRRLLTFILLFETLLIGITSCGSEGNTSLPENGGSSDGLIKEVYETVDELWSTSPLELTNQRIASLENIQKYADQCLSDYFEVYLKSIDKQALSIEKSEAILIYYRKAFGRILKDLTVPVENEETVHIWQLYNMGYIVKTVNGCFGIDLSHRWAKELAPFLDFLCITHNHSDHYSKELIDEMFALGKPVLSNYLKNELYPYTSKKPADYSIGGFEIHTSITDHNNSGLSNFVTVFQVDCKAGQHDFKLVHTGDSNYKPEQFTNMDNKVDLLIMRYAPNALTENNILGQNQGQTTPDFIFLSHILELAHSDVDSSRWSIKMALERASHIQHDCTYVPMWGEKMVWRNGKLN